MNLTGKVALVTGASRGLGHAILLRLAQEGAVVVGTSTTPAGAEHITATLAQEGYKGQGFVLDVTQQSSIDALFTELQLGCGMPDILVNNAGITQDNLLLRMSDAEWSQVIDTNLNAIFRLSKICIKAMIKKRWGRMINLSSIAGVAGNPGQANYAAAKAGMIGFSKALALEVAARNVTVNVIAPGFIDTDMTRNLTEAQQQLILSKIPMARIGKAEEIAAAAAFLASEEAAYITGTTLHINGGMYMM
ncbi:MAG: 3-oxoacyl-ACP reductase FabG [Gammaproteobacteria bacterium]